MAGHSEGHDMTLGGPHWGPHNTISLPWPHTSISAITPIVQRKLGYSEEKDGQGSYKETPTSDINK